MKLKFNINSNVVKSKNNLEIARKYHHYDNVESIHVTANEDVYHIDAVVSVFNHPQKCSLDIKDNQVISYECSCPFNDQDSMCGHLGAVILKLNELEINELPFDYQSDKLQKIKEIEKTYNTTIGIIDMKAMDISSGFIRTHSHEEIKKAVPESVYKYIIDNDLYTDTNVNRAWSINKITQDLEKELKPSRYTHTLNVAKTAKNMAEAFNVNPNKAYFAGILHDCAKNFSDKKLLQICKDNNLPINVFEERNPSLLQVLLWQRINMA